MDDKELKERRKKFVLTAIEQMLCVFCVVLSLMLTFYYAGLLTYYLAILLVLLWACYTVAIVKYAYTCYVVVKEAIKSETKVFTYNKYLTVVAIAILAYISCKANGYIDSGLDAIIMFVLMFVIGFGISVSLSIYYDSKRTKR